MRIECHLVCVGRTVRGAAGGRGAAALASVRAEGLKPSAEDLVLFAEVAAGRLSTDELRERSCPATAGEQQGW
jgi:hypothetical protein